MNQEVANLFNPQAPAQNFDADPDLDRQPGQDPVLVVRRDQEAGNDQLPDLQAGARRPVLRPHLRSDQGLRVLVRQVQADEVQGHHLREMRRRGDPVAGAPRAHGPHRTGRAGRPHLVPEVAAEPHRHAARHDPEGHRARPLFRELHRHGAGPDLAEGVPAPFRRRVHDCRRRVRRGPVHRHDRRRGDPGDPGVDGPAEDRARTARGDRRDDHLRPQAQEADEAAEGRRGVHRFAATVRNG